MDKETIIQEFHSKFRDLILEHIDKTDDEIGKLGEPLAEAYVRKMLDADELMQFAQWEYLQGALEYLRSETEYVLWYFEHRDRIPSDIQPLYEDAIQRADEQKLTIAQLEETLERIEQHIENVEENKKRIMHKHIETLCAQLFDANGFDFVIRKGMRRHRRRNTLKW